MAASGLSLHVLHHKHIFRTPCYLLTLLLSCLRRLVADGLEVNLHLSGLRSRASGSDTWLILLGKSVRVAECVSSSCQNKLLLEGKPNALNLKIALGVINIYYGFAVLMRLKDVLLESSSNARDTLAHAAPS